MWNIAIPILCLVPASAPLDTPNLGPDDIIQRVADAAGGEIWLNVETLQYDGSIRYFSRFNHNARTAARYSMWREFDRRSEQPAPTDGRVHIHVEGSEGMLFDGGNSSAEGGTLSELGAADNRWRNAFAIELVRAASRDERYQLFRLPESHVGPHSVYVLRIVAPGGQETIIGVDQSSFMLRSVGAQDAGAWRERIFDDFRLIGETGYVQPYSIRLNVNGAMAAELTLDTVQINEPIDEAIFGHRETTQ